MYIEKEEIDASQKKTRIPPPPFFEGRTKQFVERVQDKRRLDSSGKKNSGLRHGFIFSLMFMDVKKA